MAAIKLQQQQQQRQHQQKQKLNSPTTAMPTTTLKNSNNKNLRNSPQDFEAHNSTSSDIIGAIAGHSNSRSSNSSAGSIINGVVTNSSNIFGCQVCKRQKTQHNFSQPASEDVNTSDDNNSLANNSARSPSCGNASAAVINNTNQNRSLTDDDNAADDDDNETDGGKIFLGDCVDNMSIVFDVEQANCAAKISTPKSCNNFNQSEVMEQVGISFLFHKSVLTSYFHVSVFIFPGIF